MYRFFIRRPIVAIVIAIITVIIGLASMVGLPVAQYTYCLSTAPMHGVPPGDSAANSRFTALPSRAARPRVVPFSFAQ